MKIQRTMKILSIFAVAAVGCGGQPPADTTAGDLEAQSAEAKRPPKDPFSGLDSNLQTALSGIDQRINVLGRDATVIDNVVPEVLAAPDAFGNTWVRTWYTVASIPGRWFLADVWFFPQGGYDALYSFLDDQNNVQTYMRECVNNVSVPTDPYADTTNMGALFNVGLTQGQVEHVLGARTALWHNDAFLETSSSTYLFSQTASTADERRATCHKVCGWAAIAAGFAAGVGTGAACDAAAGLIAGPGGAAAAAKPCGVAGGLVGAAAAKVVSDKCHAGCDKIQ